MLSLKDINFLMKKYQIKPTKKYGQNFLINSNIISKITNYAIKDGKDIVEIGPGLGSLSLSLLEQCNSLVAYEIDQNMIEVLANEINSPKFQLVSQNFLDASFEWKNKKNIVANIPYNITSEIIFKIIKNLDKFSSATIMIQKEVGQRIMALSNSKEYGKLSVTLQSIAKIKKVVDISKNCFLPKPKVDSIVINIKFNEQPNYEYFNFIKKCFAFRRKTLNNNLKQFLSTSQINAIFKNLQLKSNIRPQEISVNQFKEMFSLII